MPRNSISKMTVAPGPAERLTVDTTSCPVQTPLGVLSDLVEQYGDFVQYETRFGKFLLVNQPEFVREVLGSSHYIRNRLLKTVLGDGLLSANGDHWQSQRRRMLPVFKPHAVAAMVDVFHRVTVERSGTWHGRAHSATPMNLTRELYHIALSSVGQILFGSTFDDRFLDALDVVMREIAAIQNAALFGFPLVRPATGIRKYQEAMIVVEEAAQSVLAGNNGKARQEAKLLEILRAHDQGPNAAPLQPQQIRDEILTMVIAGHETTATTLCWALHAIASHPDIADRFYAEVDEVTHGCAIGSADLPRLTFTRMLIDETLRLYPPVWIVAREASKDVTLGGFRIPARSGVLVSPWALHRHPAYWRHPERFDPDRFAPGTDRPHSYCYIPFLASRHLCIGKHFALAELTVVLATLAQRFRFHRCDDRHPMIEPLVSLRPRDGLFLRVESRVEQDQS